MRLMVLCAALAFQLHAGMPSAISVKTPYGPMELYGISFERWLACEFKASLSNSTGVAWANLDFKISIDAIDGSGQKASASANVHVERIGGDNVSIARGLCDVPPRFNPVAANAVLMHGQPDPLDVARFERAERQRKNAETKAAADSAARSAALAKLPILNSGSAAAFIGSDRKCAQQFQEALGMDGLEKRKRIAELVSYGCGFLADSPVRVTSGQRDGAFVLITLADGRQQGKSGWIPVAWLR
jgi:hypothetical protein